MNYSHRSKKLRTADTVLNALCTSSLYGESSKTSFQLTQLSLKHGKSFIQNFLNELYDIVKQLEDTLLCWSSSKADILQVFWDFNQEIQELEKKECDCDVVGSHKEELTVFRNFVLEHSVKVLWRFITSYSLFPTKGALEIVFSKEDSLQLKGIALELLHNVFAEYEGLASQYAVDQEFINCLFSYMQFRETCFPACKVLECIILARKTALDLSSIKNLKEIVTSLKDIQLGNFCKILAITLSELDMYENKTSLHAQTKEKKNQNFFARDVNQDVVLKIPNILSRLVNIACAKPCVPWFPFHLPIESDQWLRWIDEQLTQDRESDKTNFQSSVIGGLSRWSEYSSSGPSKTSIRISLELTFRADAVCVLGLLLVGRHRKEVQKELADLRLIPKLSNLFDHFIWKINPRDYTRLPGHNTSCECSPEVALKIQVLRLIHSFCDHSDYKHVMLSWNEYSELQSLRDTLNISSNSTWLKSELMCVGNKGLLSKIVEVIKKETGASTFRFWLSRAIESFLRGSFCNADQDFLLRRNLLQDVVHNLVSSNTRHKEVLQSSFDLLGELVKFNFSAFQELHTQIIGNPRIQKKLMNLMNGHLVDSNMFIRSLILSYEVFTNCDDDDLKGYAEKFNPLLSHVGLQRSRIQYLQKLLSLITIHNLTQENVSCLNTVLVILMFGLKKGEIPQYLHCLASNQGDCSVATSPLGGVLDNLKDLLLFWQDHYLQKDKDCTILEKSSRICFQEWKSAVSLLTSDDFKNPYTIAFYTVPAVSPRAL